MSHKGLNESLKKLYKEKRKPDRMPKLSDHTIKAPEEEGEDFDEFMERTDNLLRAGCPGNTGLMMVTEYDLDKIGRICHELNRSFCAAIGDPVAPAWEDYFEEERESVRASAALAILPNATPEGMHISWMESRAVNGWVYGKEICRENKTHPYMVPYLSLPPHQRAKDHLFITAAKLASEFCTK
jgi:hypothetical protein